MNPYCSFLARFLSWVGMRCNEVWRGYRALTVAAGMLLAVGGGWLAICHYGNLDRYACGAGAAQRLLVGIQYVWVEVVAIRLWKLASREQPSGERTAEDRP